jgi:hypothetical protein
MGFKNWFKNPTILYHWPSFIDYIMFIDENGTSELKGVRKRLRSGTEPSLGERLFTVSGVIIKRQDFPAIRNRFVTIKNTHWENGLFYYPKEQRLKRVCFKSNDIRNRTGPFSEAVINYQAFTNDLVSLVIESPYTIISANMDKLNHVNKYGSYACNPYDLCLTSIVERFSKFTLMPQKASGVLVLESRGEKKIKVY